MNDTKLAVICYDEWSVVGRRFGVTAYALHASSRSRVAHLAQGSISMIAGFEDAGRPFVHTLV